MVIVDTTVRVDYLNGQHNPETEWLEDEIGREGIGLTDLILCEVLQGLCSKAEFTAIKTQLLHFSVFRTGGMESAIAAADNFRWLRTRGCTVRQMFDCLIATFCIRQGFGLLHRDRDYDVFEKELGLHGIHP